MKQILTGLCVACGIAVSGAAVAEAPTAKLQQVSGIVLVNQGASYRTATEGLDLHAGDRVMVMDGGSMVLVYSDGCVAEFQESQIVTVSSTSSCAAGGDVAETATPKFVDAMGGGAVGGLMPATGAAVFAGAAVITAGVITANSTDNNEEEPSISKD